MPRWREDNPPYYLSAYAMACRRGFRGTEAEWLESLKIRPVSVKAEYQASQSGTVIPVGAWSEEIPAVPQGHYLWTRATQRYSAGEDLVYYSVARAGMDGAGSVVSVCGVEPDGKGNVALMAQDLDALALTGGTMTGNLSMGGKKLSGLPEPEADGDAAGKGYVDGKVGAVRDDLEEQETALKSVTVTLLAEGWTETDGFTQTVSIAAMTAAWKPGVPALEPEETKEADLLAQEALGCLSKIASGNGTLTFTCYEEKPGVDFTVRVPGVLD